jgi:hypothetical protein
MRVQSDLTRGGWIRAPVLFKPSDVERPQIGWTIGDRQTDLARAGSASTFG